ncbi:MAG: hypothetical protein ABI336_11720 [Humibacillus sp.]
MREQMESWRGHRGEAVDKTVAHLEALRSAGQRTYVFTNGTDLVPHELEQLGHPVARAAVWFTDDRDENVAGAREFGWDAALFVR